MKTATQTPHAWQWLEMMRRGEYSAEQVAAHHLQRIQDTASSLNAIAALDQDAVFDQARAADRARRAGADLALLGLPVTVKDNLQVAGLTCSAGTWGRRNTVAEADACAVARMRRHGAVILAKSTMPELASSYETENGITGRTNHPLDPARTPGGSSGGEAALLAAAASPLGLGTDGGGSIRVPAHYCGIFGLRPTVGRVPETGVWPPSRATGYADLSCVGPMGRSTRDVGLLLGVIAGADDVDPFAADLPLHGDDGVAVAGMRIAFYDDDGVAPPTSGTRAAVHRAAALLAELGADVVQVPPPDVHQATTLFFAAAGAAGGHDLLEHIDGANGHHAEQFRTFLSLMELRRPTAVEYFASLRELHRFRARIRAWVRTVDAVITPVVAGPAPLHGHPPAGYPHDEYFTYRAFNYTHTFSLAGLPAMSVPVTSEKGLPVGVQVVSSAWQEHVVLAISQALENVVAARDDAV